MDFLAIIAIVERGEANAVVKKACEAGARGATIAYGRGSGEHVVAGFHAMQIETSKEVILIIASSEDADHISTAVAEAAKAEEAGKSVVFVLPIVKMLGNAALAGLAQDDQNLKPGAKPDKK